MSLNLRIIEKIQTLFEIVICFQINPNLMEFRLHTCILNNSTVIEVYDDKFWISYDFLGGQLYRLIAAIFHFKFLIFPADRGINPPVPPIFFL